MKKKATSFIFWALLSVLTMTSFKLIQQKNTFVSDCTSTLNEVAIVDNSSYCYTENLTFQQGERLTYKLFYKLKFLWLPAGEVEFSVQTNEDGSLHLSGKGRTYKSYEWFLKVRNSYDCDINQQSLLPKVSVRNIHEGKYRDLYEKIVFNQEERMAHSALGCSEEKSKAEEIPLEDCVYDILSALYYTRNINLENQEPGTKFPLNILIDQQIQKLNLIYKGKQNRKRIKGRGRFNTIHFSPETLPGNVFKKDAKMDIWISDDENRLPLMIRSPLMSGQIKAVLKKYEGLRHELTSKVK